MILDGPVHASARPTLVFGNRGIAQATLTVFGPRAPLHSGHYGNYVPNPALRLAALLATMKDEDGRVLIPGYYDGVRLTDADRVGAGGRRRRRGRRCARASASRARSASAANYQESLQYPSLNVRGMAAGGVGARAANIVPSEAVAEIDFRTTPETDGRRLYELVHAHIEAQGYHLVDGEPTDEERAQFDKLASFTLGSGASRGAHADGLRDRPLGDRGAARADRAAARRRARADPHDGRHGARRTCWSKRCGCRSCSCPRSTTTTTSTRATRTCGSVTS